MNRNVEAKNATELYASVWEKSTLARTFEIVETCSLVFGNSRTHDVISNPLMADSISEGKSS